MLDEIAYCVNLDRRLDRWGSFLCRVAKVNGMPFTFERWVAADGANIDPPSWWKDSPGAYGCYVSHLRLLERCLSEETDAIVFEDDCIFCDDFAGRLITFLEHVPDDWEMLYLGGQHLLPPKQVNEHVVLCSNVNRTHAYLVRKGQAMRKAYKHVAEHIKPSKRKQHIDYLYGSLQEAGGIKAYGPMSPWLCGQAADPSDVTPKIPRPQPLWWNQFRLKDE